MRAKLIVIEGADGAGTTTHTDILAAALRSEGVDAVAWHHTRPGLGAPWLDALAYAQQRADLVASDPRAAVIVADRWWHSTMFEGRALRLAALRTLADAESLALPRYAALFVLDAPDDVLDARITARGETVDPLDHARRAVYRAFSVARDTSAPVAEVTRTLMRASLAAIGGAR